MTFSQVCRRPIVSAVFLVAVLVLGGALGMSAMTGPKNVAVTDRDDGAKVHLTIGGILIVRLEAPRGGGFVWQVARNNPQRLKPLARPPDDKSGKGLPGSVEVQALYFQGEAAGACELELHYQAVAVKDAKPLKVFKLTVTIE
jgi:inhibitor of cysteine peptidase